MAFVNEAVWDRIVRIVVGAVILYLGFGGVVTGTLGIVLIVIGFLLLLTGIFGYSPVYSILKCKTKKVEAAQPAPAPEEESRPEEKVEPEPTPEEESRPEERVEPEPTPEEKSPLE